MVSKTSQVVTVSASDLSNLLEPLIRKIVREELARVVTQQARVFHLKPDSPLYQDMAEILRRKNQGDIKLHSHAEVWSE